MFAGRRLVIATMHGKEQAIAPVLETVLGVHCEVVQGLDTDALGTFSGEVERTLEPLDAARHKCERAMELTGADLAVASEGSFGAHPTLFFASADDEFVVMVDRLHGIEVVGRELSTDTNFASETVHREDELRSFAEKVGFPEHGLILRSTDDGGEMVKGIREWSDLWSAFGRLLEQVGVVRVETDMRAMHNPRRMSVIEKAAKRMAERALVRCPKCSTPGFGLIGLEKGLPCSVCGTPTNEVLAEIHGCRRCGHKKQVVPDQRQALADPKWCPLCNP